ncbi:hypothetical protein N8615_01415 [Verrucomicrobiales bacterium]|nr:hypothetical protein [Verrucomicrobiales bacterium]MDB4657621.1 hypothetical protein [Verrucomicrobiales bacterium]
MIKRLTLMTITFAIAASAFGQGPRAKGKGGPLSIEGQELPELTAFDESGKEVALKQVLKGRHGVIVFGCLT